MRKNKKFEVKDMEPWSKGTVILLMLSLDTWNLTG